MYINDPEAIALLERLHNSLTPHGVIIVKENLIAPKTLKVSADNRCRQEYSLSRSLNCFRSIFASAGFQPQCEATPEICSSHDKVYTCKLVPVEPVKRGDKQHQKECVGHHWDMK